MTVYLYDTLQFLLLLTPGPESYTLGVSFHSREEKEEEKEGEGGDRKSDSRSTSRTLDPGSTRESVTNG